MKKRTFGEHYKFAMGCFGIAPVTGVYNTITQTALWIHGMNVYFETYGTTTTLSKLFFELEKLKLPTSVYSYRVGVGNQLLAMSAALYAGINIGAFVYAIGIYSSERLWTIHDPNPIYKKPYKIINTKYKHLVTAPNLQNYLKNDFANDLKKMKCIPSH